MSRLAKRYRDMLAALRATFGDEHERLAPAIEELTALLDEIDQAERDRDVYVAMVVAIDSEAHRYRLAWQSARTRARVTLAAAFDIEDALAATLERCRAEHDPRGVDGRCGCGTRDCATAAILNPHDEP